MGGWVGRACAVGTLCAAPLPNGTGPAARCGAAPAGAAPAVHAAADTGSSSPTQTATAAAVESISPSMMFLGMGQFDMLFHHYPPVITQ